MKLLHENTRRITICDDKVGKLIYRPRLRRLQHSFGQIGFIHYGFVGLNETRDDFILHHAGQTGDASGQCR
ncbi:MAG: hypothetical protein AAGA21_01820 [Pseudomonadota bacterium]